MSSPSTVRKTSNPVIPPTKKSKAKRANARSRIVLPNVPVKERDHKNETPEPVLFSKPPSTNSSASVAKLELPMKKKRNKQRFDAASGTAWTNAKHRSAAPRSHMLGLLECARGQTIHFTAPEPTYEPATVTFEAFATSDDLAALKANSYGMFLPRNAQEGSALLERLVPVSTRLRSKLSMLGTERWYTEDGRERLVGALAQFLSQSPRPDGQQRGCALELLRALSYGEHDGRFPCPGFYNRPLPQYRESASIAERISITAHLGDELDFAKMLASLKALGCSPQDVADSSSRVPPNLYRLFADAFELAQRPRREHEAVYWRARFARVNAALAQLREAIAMDEPQDASIRGILDSLFRAYPNPSLLELTLLVRQQFFAASSAVSMQERLIEAMQASCRAISGSEVAPVMPLDDELFEVTMGEHVDHIINNRFIEPHELLFILPKTAGFRGLLRGALEGDDGSPRAMDRFRDHIAPFLQTVVNGPEEIREELLELPVTRPLRSLEKCILSIVPLFEKDLAQDNGLVQVLCQPETPLVTRFVHALLPEETSLALRPNGLDQDPFEVRLETARSLLQSVPGPLFNRYYDRAFLSTADTERASKEGVDRFVILGKSARK